MEKSKVSNTKAVVTALAKMVVKSAWTVSIFAVILAFAFDFRTAQAIGLGLAFALAIDLAASRKTPEQAKFTPHRLSIQFHVGHTLLDLGLLPSDEQWKTLIQSIPESEVWNAQSVYRRFVVGYVIGRDPKLIHYPDLRMYTENWQLDFKLEDVTSGDTDSLWVWHPELYVKLGRGGYHLGVRVNEKWWEANRASVAQGVVLQENKEYQFGTVRLCLAVLPYDITATYYRDTPRDHQEALKEQVAKHGWENKDLGYAEVGYFGESYTHKYATVLAQHLPE